MWARTTNIVDPDSIDKTIFSCLLLLVSALNCGAFELVLLEFVVPFLKFSEYLILGLHVKYFFYHDFIDVLWHPEELH